MPEKRWQPVDSPYNLTEAQAAITAENDKLSGLKAQLEPFGEISYYISRIYLARPNIDEQDGRAESVSQNTDRRHQEEIPAPEPPKKRRISEPSL